MARLPQPGSDDGTWGDILNDFLSVEHNADGTLNDTSGTVAAKADDSNVVHNTTNESVGGIKTFVLSPIVPTPSTGTQAANKTYVDGVVSGGAPDATTSTKGIVQLAGDLSGTATAPTIANNAVTAAKIANTTITDAQISGSAAIAQSKIANLTTDLSGKQASDADLTAIAALTPTNDDVIQRKAGAWTNRTPAQVKTDLSLAKADVGLGNVDNTSDANKPISTATQTALDARQASDADLTAIAALTPTNDDLIQRKAGAWTNRTPAQVKTDLSLTKTDVGLANVDNTSDANKPVSTAAQTALDARLVWVTVVDANTARPAGATRVIWIGFTVQPVNMQTGDIWLKEGP